MNALRRVGAALAITLACMAQAREPALGGYKSFSGADYTLIARSDRDAARVALAVEKVDWLLSKMVKPDSHASRAPTYIIMVPPATFIRYLQPGNGIIAEFAPGRFTNYLLVSAVPDNATATNALYHEYTHLFVHTRFRGVKPLWFDEGMAEVVEHSTFANSYVEVGLVQDPPEQWFPLDRLLRFDKSSPEYRERLTTQSVHSESWAIMHLALLDDMQFRTQLFAFLAALNELTPLDEAVQSSFNMNVAQLDARMRSYVHGVSFNSARIPFDAPRRKKQAGASMTELDTTLRMADAMFVSGFQPQNLHELVESATRLAPDAPEVLALRMRLAARDHDDTTLIPLARDIDAEEASPVLARGAGLALFERVYQQGSSELGGDRGQSTRSQAIDLLDRAIIANSDDAEAVWAFGMLAADLNRSLVTAARRVNEVRQAHPYNPDLAMAAARLCEAQGDTASAVSNMSLVLQLSRVPEQKIWASAQLERLKGGTNRYPAVIK